MASPSVPRVRASSPQPVTTSSARSTSSSARRQQLSKTVQREIAHLPLSQHEHQRLEQTALHPGHSQADRRAARDLRRVLVATRSMHPSAQAALVKPFLHHPTGAEARAAASLTRRKDFRTAPTAQREAMAHIFPSADPAKVGQLAAATRQVFSTSLTPPQRTNVLHHAFSRSNPPQERQRAQDVLHATQQLPPKAQAALLRPFAHATAPGADATSAHQLVHSASWQQGSANDRLQLSQVFGAADAPGMQNRSDPQGPLDSLNQLARSPARLLQDKDSQGNNLLSNLNTLATGPLNPSIGESRRGELLSGVLQETAYPGDVDQCDFGTCTVTSMQYELARDTPAEYARLISGLAGPAGRATMRGGGDLELQPDSLGPGALQGRSFSEALFQSAGMEYANGTDDYQVLGGGGPEGLDASVRPDGSKYGGQYTSGEVRLLDSLFSRSYSSWDTTADNSGAQLDFLRNYQPQGPNNPVLLSLYTEPNQQGGHAVDFVKVEGDRVFFRNPWGAGGKAGDEVFPGARVEDPSTGLDSISVAQFQQIVYEVLAPEDAPGYGSSLAAA